VHFTFHSIFVSFRTRALHDEFADRELVTLVVNGQWCSAEMLWCWLRWLVAMWL